MGTHEGAKARDHFAGVYGTLRQAQGTLKSLPFQRSEFTAIVKPTRVNTTSPSAAAEGKLLLGIDTCGPSGSVALGRLGGNCAVQILGQKELAGRSYSATLVAAVGELLAAAGVRLSEVTAIVVVNGPGSFTGVRVGLSAVKGLAEVKRIPVAAVSRLEVLAWKAGLGAAALDAHRQEVFLRLVGTGREPREKLAGTEELAAIRPAPARVALCDSAEALLHRTWPGTEVVRAEAPSAADALQLCAERVTRGEFVEMALLDGHYLRRSDAEIFGEPGAVAAHPSRKKKDAGRMGRPIEEYSRSQIRDLGHPREVRIRPMGAEDLARVLEIERGLKTAPHWTRAAWDRVLDRDAARRRMAVVAEERKSGAVQGFAVAAVTVPEAELESIAVAAGWQRRGVARRLLGSLADELRRAEVWEAFLEVRASNRAALGFYEALGFVETGRRARYYADPEEDAVLMRLKLG